MRGPGPKSLDMIGKGLRDKTEDITREPLPERWLTLVQSLREQQASCPDPAAPRKERDRARDVPNRRAAQRPCNEQ